MQYRKPEKLKKNDLIGIITPASLPKDMGRIERSAGYFEKQGYRVLIGKNVGKSYGYLAGTDEQRLEDLHSMFENKEVKAIFCARGGYGTPRLLRGIDYRLIGRNPKIFVGYSDITALQMAFLKKAKLITFAAPMPAVDFHSRVSPYAKKHFFARLSSVKAAGQVQMPGKRKMKALAKGKAAGEIIGGNLALIAALAGSPYLPNPKDKILMFEEVGEAPYRIDRMLNQLAITGVLDACAGIIIGECTGCKDDPDAKTLSLAQIYKHYLGSLGKPVITGFPHGHVSNNYTVPFGTKVELNADKAEVKFLEGAVI